MCSYITHTYCRHMHKNTVSFSLHTHPSESPASLPPLVSVSLGKEKKITPGSAGSDSPRFSSFFLHCRLPLLYNAPASCRCLCTAPGLHIPTRGLSNGSPLIFLSSSSSVFSLHSTVPLLSFPSLPSALAPPLPPPPPHSSLPSLTFVCQPPCL